MNMIGDTGSDEPVAENGQPVATGPPAGAEADGAAKSTPSSTDRQAVTFENGILMVTGYGAFVGKHSERVRVTIKQEPLIEAAAIKLEHVLIASDGVTVSTDALRLCAERGIPVTLLTGSGSPYAQVLGVEQGGTVRTRREQILSYEDERGAAIVRIFARAKVLNQGALLKYIAKYRRGRAEAVFQQLRDAALEIERLAGEIEHVKGESADEVRQGVMLREAHAAKCYWEAFRVGLPAKLGFPGRVTQGAADPVNAALNYGYGILYGDVQRAVVLAGLDPYGGFLHVDACTELSAKQ